MKRLLGIVVLLTGLGTLWGVQADEPEGLLTTADAVAIHKVVQSQLDALANDDAAGAFELTSPAKRTQIGSADNFLRMIKEEYPPIYRPQRAIFSTPQVVHGHPIQIVRLTDGYSHVWVAIFWMKLEEDNSWKIDGCQLLETTSVST